MSDNKDENKVIPLVNRFRKSTDVADPDAKLSATYTVEVTPAPPSAAPPTKRVFNVLNAKVTETFNVIRRLIESPPAGTRLIAFTIFPTGYTAKDILDQAGILFNSTLAATTYANEQNKDIHPAKKETTPEETPSQPAETTQDGGPSHPAPSGVADAGPEQPGIPAQP
jgi:hypothetical protein